MLSTPDYLSYAGACGFSWGQVGVPRVATWGVPLRGPQGISQGIPWGPFVGIQGNSPGVALGAIIKGFTGEWLRIRARFDQNHCHRWKTMFFHQIILRLRNNLFTFNSVRLLCARWCFSGVLF